MTTSDNAELFPVGYYLGEFLDAAPTSAENFEQSTRTHTLIRRGWREHRLDRTILAEVWAMLAGSGTGSGSDSWVRDTVAARYLTLIEERGRWQAVDVPSLDNTTEADIHTAIDQLVAEGLAVELPPDVDATEYLMHEVSLRPLLMGLGNSAASPLSYQIGLPVQPILRLGARTFDYWAELDSLPTLWDACEKFARAPDYATMTDSPLNTPRGQIPLVLSDVRQLLTYGAAYLDLPWTPGTPLPTETDN